MLQLCCSQCPGIFPSQCAWQGLKPPELYTPAFTSAGNLGLGKKNHAFGQVVRLQCSLQPVNGAVQKWPLQSPMPWERGAQICSSAPSTQSQFDGGTRLRGGRWWRMDSSITSRQRALRHPPNDILGRNKANCCFSVSPRVLSQQSPSAYA